jgi:hypothetical protein
MNDNDDKEWGVLQTQAPKEANPAGVLLSHQWMSKIYIYGLVAWWVSLILFSLKAPTSRISSPMTPVAPTITPTIITPTYLPSNCYSPYLMSLLILDPIASNFIYKYKNPVPRNHTISSK